MPAPAVPEPVYHYTDGNGLLGILGNRKLWCTHFAFLNDTGEANYARVLYGEALYRIATDPTVDEPTRGVASEMASRFDRNEATAATQQRLRSANANFVASFSAARDDIGQWRGYSAPSARYSIGFNANALQAVAAAEGMQLQEVHYDRNAAIDQLAQAALLWMSRIDEGLKRTPERIDSMGLVSDLMFTVARTGAWFKHPKFKSEREWRLAFAEVGLSRSQPLSFRPGRSYLVPYIELNLAGYPDLISEVWIGPSPHPELSEAAVWQLLNQHGYGSGGHMPEVLWSEVPYRDW